MLYMWPLHSLNIILKLAKMLGCLRQAYVTIIMVRAVLVCGVNFHTGAVVAVLATHNLSAVLFVFHTIQSKAPNQLFQLAKSPVKVDILQNRLRNYPLLDVKQELLEGFKCGFSLCYTGPRNPRESPNLKSARENPNVVIMKINKELEMGRIVGPFVDRPISTLRISPLGLVEKKEPGKFRMIHHLSYPQGDSVNDFIDPKLCSVEYTKFDRAVDIIQELGVGCMLAKADIESAFRLLPVYPGDFDQLGFKFNGRYYVDKCMPMGCSISCSIFEKFSSFLEWNINQRHTAGCKIHYIDDFLFGDRTFSECQHLLDAFLFECGKLGVPIAEEKTMGPSTCIQFLGLELDTVAMLVRIPESKVSEICEKIVLLLSMKKAQLHQIQSLIGSLNFACRAIIPGRAFSRRLTDLTIGLTRPNHFVRINTGVKDDLRMWLQFFKNFNGKCAFSDRFWLTCDQLQLFTDSAGGPSGGWGIYFEGSWSQGLWPSEWLDLGVGSDITFLEFFPVVLSIIIFGDRLKNRKLIVRSDNTAVVAILNSHTSKSQRVMSLVRVFVLRCLHLNLIVKGMHVCGRNNQIADALSRSQWSSFRRLAPGADVERTPVPPSVWSLFVVK